MVGHEIFSLLGLIVVGTIVLTSFRNGSQTATVLNSGFTGFSNLLNAMQGGSAPAGTAQAG